MKFTVSIKTPDCVYYAVEDIIENEYVPEPEDFTHDEDEEAGWK